MQRAVEPEAEKIQDECKCQREERAPTSTRYVTPSMLRGISSGYQAHAMEETMMLFSSCPWSKNCQLRPQLDQVENKSLLKQANDVQAYPCPGTGAVQT
jgi:hypothetical protein